jgi:HK97 family phage prohead protease
MALPWFSVKKIVTTNGTSTATDNSAANVLPAGTSAVEESMKDAGLNKDVLESSVPATERVRGRVKSVLANIEVKDVDGERRITGYASRNTVDRMREIVLPSAFEARLDVFKANPVMLYMHDPSRVVGRWDVTEIRPDGLWVSGVLAKGVPDADMAWSLISQGMIKTLSIGFRELDGDFDADTEIYQIKQLELYEVSIVSIPANREAMFSVEKSGGKLLGIELLPTDVKRLEDEELLHEMQSRGLTTASESTDADTPVRPLITRGWELGTCAGCNAESAKVIPFADVRGVTWSLCLQCFAPEDVMEQWTTQLQAITSRLEGLEAKEQELSVANRELTKAILGLVKYQAQRLLPPH